MMTPEQEYAIRLCVRVQESLLIVIDDSRDTHTGDVLKRAHHNALRIRINELRLAVKAIEALEHLSKR